MSLSDEERKIIVQIELEKSQQAYEEALLLCEKGFWSGSAGRLYYALFHAVSALLISNRHQVNSHKGSHILFSNYFIKTGIIPQEYGRLYSNMEKMRESGEYDCTYDVDPAELKRSFSPAKEMIDLITKIVKE